MHAQSERILEIIRAIPVGSVRSYGGVAKAAGLPHGARQVARLLHSANVAVPWHRVVNAQRRISLTGVSGEKQRALLESEGVEFDAHDRIVSSCFLG